MGLGEQVGKRGGGQEDIRVCSGQAPVVSTGSPPYGNFAGRNFPKLTPSQRQGVSLGQPLMVCLLRKADSEAASWAVGGGLHAKPLARLLFAAPYSPGLRGTWQWLGKSPYPPVRPPASSGNQVLPASPPLLLLVCLLGPRQWCPVLASRTRSCCKPR